MLDREIEKNLFIRRFKMRGYNDSKKTQEINRVIKPLVKSEINYRNSP